MSESDTPSPIQSTTEERSADKSVPAGDVATKTDSTEQTKEPKRLAYEPTPIIELVRTPEGKIGLALCVGKKDGKIEAAGGWNFTYNGRRYSTPDLSATLQEALVLPTKFTSVSSTRDLFENVLAFFQKHVRLPRRDLSLLTFWSTATWFSDFLPFFPCLEVTGPPAGVDILFKVLMAVCRRSVMLADVSPTILRSFPVAELMPTLLIREPQLTKRMASMLEASTQPGYLVSDGKDFHRLFCPKCIYVGDRAHKDIGLKNSLSIHLESNSWRSLSSLLNEEVVQDFQSRLFSYRLFGHDKVAKSNFRVSGLQQEVCAIAEVLGAVIVDDTELQGRIIELMKERDDQSRVDRSSGLYGMVVRAVLLHCHQSEQPRLFVREIAETVNQIYREEGESSKVSSETVGHVLKSLGLYSQRLGNAGRGLILEKSVQSQVHRLGSAYEVLPEAAACGHCHELQESQSEELV